MNDPLADVARQALADAAREALALVRATDAVWLQRSAYNSAYFAYDMIGYTDRTDVFHESVTCPALGVPAQRIPETKALKWDYTYCDRCVEE